MVGLATGSPGFWRWAKTGLIFFLLIVLQMRLVWMQLREFRVQRTPRTELAIDTLDREFGLPCLRATGADLGPLVSQSGNPLNVATNRESSGLLTVQSPGVTGLLAVWFCRSGRNADQSWIKTNQWVFVATVATAALIGRIVASSWTIALIGAATIATRGSLLTGIGDFGPENYLTLAYTLWFLAIMHYLRSGSWPVFAASGLALICGTLFDPAFLYVGLALPIFVAGVMVTRPLLVRPLMNQVRQRIRAMRQRALWARQFVLPLPQSKALADDHPFFRYLAAARRFIGLEVPTGPEPITWRRRYERGNIFRPAEVPFLIWALPERSGGLRWRPIGIIGAGMLLVFFAVLASVGAFALMRTGAPFDYANLELPPVGLLPWLRHWYFEVFTGFDVHLLVCLGLTLWAATQSPAHGLPGYYEVVWVFLISGVTLLAGAFVHDIRDAQIVSSALPWIGPGQLLALRAVWTWMEPTLLVLGVTGCVNAMKVIDARGKAASS